MARERQRQQVFPPEPAVRADWTKILSAIGAATTAATLIWRMWVGGHSTAVRFVERTSEPVARRVAREVVADTMAHHRREPQPQPRKDRTRAR